MTNDEAIRAAAELAAHTSQDVEYDVCELWKRAALAEDEDRAQIIAMASDAEEHADELRQLAGHLAEMASERRVDQRGRGVRHFA